jgi:hypothetical protein
LALIRSGGNYFDRDNRQMSESELTKLWLKHGHATLAPSEQRTQTASGDVATPTVVATVDGNEAAQPLAVTPKRKRRRVKNSLERKHSLDEMAYRLTGKRTRKHEP